MNKTIVFSRILLICLILPLYHAASGQVNFQPGYIIKLNGDTLNGYIDYQNWEANPNSINFKENLNGENAELKPAHIKKFKVANEVYESAIIEIVTNKRQDIYLKSNNKLLLKTDTAFIQTIIEGPKSLYSFQDNLGETHFYIKTDSSYKLLIYNRYITERSGLDVFEENKTYLGQLKYYFLDNPEIQSKINYVKYDKKSIEKLFLSYYKNNNQAIIEFQKKKDKVSLEFGIIAGASLSIIEFTGYGVQYLNSNNSSINPAAGIFLDIIRPRNQGKWSLNSELTYTTFKISSSFYDYVSDNEYSTTNAELAYAYIRLNNLIRYKYPVGKCHIYVNAGFSNGYAIYEKNYKKVVSKFYSMDRETTGKAISDTRKYEQGYIVGFGVKFKKYSVEIRIEKSNGMSQFSGLSSAITKNYILIGYKF